MAVLAEMDCGRLERVIIYRHIMKVARTRVAEGHIPVATLRLTVPNAYVRKEKQMNRLGPAKGTEMSNAKERPCNNSKLRS